MAMSHRARLKMKRLVDLRFALSTQITTIIEILPAKETKMRIEYRITLIVNEMYSNIVLSCERNLLY